LLLEVDFISLTRTVQPKRERVKLIIFGLSISSTLGATRASLWRGLCRALGQRGHEMTFFERDFASHAARRDPAEIPGVRLRLYRRWEDVLPEARRCLAGADAVIVTSCCPDALAASDLGLSSSARVRVFYELDPPRALGLARAGKPIPYLGPQGLGDFDLTLSYTGGRALIELKQRMGARRVEPFYSCVDPMFYYPAPVTDAYRAHLSYLGSYDEDRRGPLEELLLNAARRLPDRRFLVGGALYPEPFREVENLRFIDRVAESERPAFYCSSTLTLNVPRGEMARMGWCPSNRLFEAAACGAPVISEWWDGLDHFFEPGEEIIIARSVDDVIDAMDAPEEDLTQIALRGHARVLEEHSAQRRAAELERLLESVRGGDARKGAFSSGAS
jgi:spore maturation protein CgeB